MKPTISDVAKLCGVSKGTVNRALHDKPGISPKTKDAILQVMRDLNYQPDYFATSLATGKTNTIGMIVPNVHNEFFAMLYTSIEKLCWQNGYMLNLALSDDDYEKEEKYLDSFLSRKVDGIILFPVGTENQKLQAAVQQNIPVVAVLNPVEDVNVNIVAIDDYLAMKTTVDHVIASGHTRIAYVDGYIHYTAQYNTSINNRRYKAYKDSLTNAGIQVDDKLYVEVDEFYYETSGVATLRRLLEMAPPPTTIVCFHDRIAIWLSKAARDMGLEVPGDISLTGFDDIDELSLIDPKIATTRMPTMEIAQKTVELLLHDIKQRKCSGQKIILNTEFIKNDSIVKIN